MKNSKISPLLDALLGSFCWIEKNNNILNGRMNATGKSVRSLFYNVRPIELNNSQHEYVFEVYGFKKRVFVNLETSVTYVQAYTLRRACGLVLIAFVALLAFVVLGLFRSGITEFIVGCFFWFLVLFVFVGITKIEENIVRHLFTKSFTAV